MVIPKLVKDEMKWYLPAIYQYMDIWMGDIRVAEWFRSLSEEQGL